jgi:nicotinamide riboside kinase
MAERGDPAFVIGLLGAESTGKTTLARNLGTALANDGRRVAVVDEFLRSFCAAHGRTPRVDEQAGIAAEQTRRISAAACVHDVVVADTTALMIAVYSDQVFGDRSLYGAAIAGHARCDLTLLTALDVAWQPDGLQRDGPQVREPVDARIRTALVGAGLAYTVIHGQGDARSALALDCVQRALLRSTLRAAVDDGQPRWQARCERCDDIGCERHARRLLPRPDA